MFSKNSKANRIETGERSGGIRRNLFNVSFRQPARAMRPDLPDLPKVL
jgi:hypothetical protein